MNIQEFKYWATKQRNNQTVWIPVLLKPLSPYHPRTTDGHSMELERSRLSAIQVILSTISRVIVGLFLRFQYHQVKKPLKVKNLNN